MTVKQEAFAAVMRAREKQRRKHGNRRRYAAGCRCGTCKAANRRACEAYGSIVRFLRAGGR